MTKHKIDGIKDYDIAADGRRIVLNFSDPKDALISLDMDSITLEKIHHDIGLAITKARQLSEFGKQNIVSVVRPVQESANLADHEPVVVISFLDGNGLALHYGLEARRAGALALRILDEAKRGISANPAAQN